MDGAHLGDPGRAGLDFADGAKLLARVTGDADVVGALEDELNVADLEDLAPALLGVAAGGVKDAVDETVGKVEDGLRGKKNVSCNARHS